MTPERANDIGYLLDNFEQHAVAAHAEQTDSADERLREAAKAITDLVERLTAERDEARTECERMRPVVKAAEAWRDTTSAEATDALVAAVDALHPTNPTRLAEVPHG